jgi:hypothetical protein
MTITKEVFDDYVEKSFFNQYNFSGRFTPSKISSNMIPYKDLQEFHYQTSFFLNFYASLYIELKKHESDITYNITTFTKTIENLGIIIDSSTTINNLSAFTSNNFIFYVNTFEAKTSNQAELYKYGISLSSTIAYLSAYSDIINISKPNFGSNPITLTITSNSILYLNTLILKSSTTLFKTDILNRTNSLSSIPENNKIIKKDNKSKFKEIIEEILFQTPENILGYLLYKKLYYNIILYNINIQNIIRTNYLNYYDNTSLTINNISETNYKYNLITTSQDIKISKDITCDILIVGGGGGGGFNGGGGGGGGEVLYYTNDDISFKSGKSILLNIGTYNIIIGEGGSGGKYQINGQNGLISSIINSSTNTIIVSAKGGGKGGSIDQIGNGGNVGGAGGSGKNIYSGYATSEYGGNGGNGDVDMGGGGGGGANISDINKNGKNGVRSIYNGGGDGGDGININITGTLIEYGGGGGGGSTHSSSKKGLGKFGGGYGGGYGYENGILKMINGENGKINTGGGGGGGCMMGAGGVDNMGNGGNGGSGIVIIRYTDKDNEVIINKVRTYDENKAIKTTKINEIKNLIKENTTNITELNRIHFVNVNNEFLIEKNNYRNKISALNNLKNEFFKTQDILNTSIKLYNDQFKKYKFVKKYSTYIIISLIIIIILIIVVSLFPFFSYNTLKNIYILLLVILIIITFIYYINFKYINLYENFVAIGSETNLISLSSLSDHATFYNDLLPAINEYSNAYNDLLNNMRVNINTIGNKTFSRDSNIYLYNLYLEKKRQVEYNHIKSTNLFNFIEVIKKNIDYLFNIILIISCFTIILLISLIIYSIVPFLYIFIIVLCVVLITILMIYFTIVIIQPTRMIANKKYWASENPALKTIHMI